MTMIESELGLPLSEWADRLDHMQWSAMILDADWNLKWTSRSLRGFLRVGDDADLGYGRSIAEAWTTREEWTLTATPESQMQLFAEVAPVFVKAMAERGLDPSELMGEPFASLIRDIEPAASLPFVWSSSFEYRDPQDLELPPYRVNFAAIRVNDDSGATLGIIFIFFIDMNPNLMTLLVRGDQAMHERMAGLVDPKPREAAVLFCDLSESGRLSRELSSAVYFQMVRRLWTGIDAAIATECGIVGKHAGDGAAAFFLAEDLGSASQAAAAALRAARRIHDISSKVFRDVLDSDCVMKLGLHWGGSLYMGQLVPGGRLEVTALGDEVNEAARVQESAQPGTTLVTKQLVERLETLDAVEVGVDVETTRFKPLSDLQSVSDKARRDAGGIAVFSIE